MSALMEPYSENRHIEFEGLNPATYEGFKVGDRVKLAVDLADDLKAGAVGIITELDDHAVYPVTITVQRPAGQDITGLPVALNEVVVTA